MQGTEGLEDQSSREASKALLGRFRVRLIDLVKDETLQRPLEEKGVDRLVKSIKKSGLRRLQHPLFALGRPSCFQIKSSLTKQESCQKAGLTGSTKLN